MNGNKGTNMDLLPDFLTPDEAEELMHISEHALRRMVESHLIPVYRVAGSLRFDRQDVQEFIEKNKTGDGALNTYIALHKSHKRT